MGEEGGDKGRAVCNGREDGQRQGNQAYIHSGEGNGARKSPDHARFEVFPILKRILLAAQHVHIRQTERDEGARKRVLKNTHAVSLKHVLACREHARVEDVGEVDPQN